MSYEERSMFPGINLGFKGELLKTVFKNKPASERIIVKAPRYSGRKDTQINKGDIIICNNIMYQSSYSDKLSKCDILIIRPDGTEEQFENCSIGDLHKGIWKQLPYSTLENE